MSLWREVGDGVLVRRYAELDQNIGLVLSEDGLLLVDSRAHPHHARVLREDVATVSALPVRWLINTHFHWDHCFGNAVFPDAVVVGHRRCRDGLLGTGAAGGQVQLDRLRSADWFPAAEKPFLDEVEVVPPSLCVEDASDLWLGRRRVRLAHHGRGHTDSDLVVRVDDVTFAGDLVEQGAPPAFGDSYPGEWVRTLRRAGPGLGATVVPGHGDVVDPTYVRAQAEEIEAAVAGRAVYPSAVMAVVAARERLATVGVDPPAPWGAGGATMAG